MKTEEMQVAELIPYERNAKRHDDRQVANVMESIREFGFAQPIVADKNNVVIIGHCRLIAAKRLGLRTVPVLRMEELNEEQAQKLRLLDNKLNESEWDMELLAEDIPELDWSGFDIDWEIEQMGDEAVDIVETEVPEEPEEPQAKVGDLYQLGAHRLICGDSTDAEVLRQLMDGAVADLLLTDPPYNVNYEEKEKALLKARPNARVAKGQKTEIKNDAMDGESFRAFLVAAFKAAQEVMKPGAAFYIWHAESEGLNFRTAAQAAGLTIRQCLVWVKQHFVLGRQDYQWIHEPCLYGWTEGAAHYFIHDRTNSTVLEYPEDLKKLKKEELIKIIEQMHQEPTSIIKHDKPTKSALHPTMKPTELMADLIKNSSRPGENILDTFGGSGTTLMAAEQLGRHCFMSELNPVYIDVIIKRWEEYTGQKAVKLNG